MSRYRGLAVPGLLILIGAIALAANLNLVQWDALYRLVDLWPALLILIGAELVLRTALPPRMASAAGMLLAVLAAAAAVTHVAAAHAIPLARLLLTRPSPGPGPHPACPHTDLHRAEDALRRTTPRGPAGNSTKPCPRPAHRECGTQTSGANAAVKPRLRCS